MTQSTQQKQTGQAWNTTAYAANGRFVADMAFGVVDWLDPKPGERILDLGCGDGVLTQRLAATGAILTGVDSSPAMLAAAHSLGLNVVERKATELAFENAFDAVFSNAALHWIHKTGQPALLQGVHRALVPGGRFVAEMGGIGNIASIRVALQSVLKRYGIDAETQADSFYPSPKAYGALLADAGFRVERMELIPRPTPLPNGMESWLTTFRNGVLDLLAPSDKSDVLHEVTELLAHVLRDSDGAWTADYVRLRFISIAE
ncbi:methyltransferase domain-containing protein [Terriglobus saanensis]|uniref:Methyltransferase type 11 n=1 Tax=Terriglobus saanensis (strain ATCC BAA-1853 / DSM 23119 / SP1PR4) TaxID=401053 RepID=E8V0B7_TERSS|nr:methyltransferase domain-containing protein [Terriglobus saanensis]ADV83335.1 Methyltransferase type 11 [Terriglobus saanensis SP1PR4]